MLAVAMLWAAGGAPAPGAAPAGAYDPMALPAGERAAPADLTVTDRARGRVIPLRVYLPGTTAPAPAPVLLFSHGLGGSRTGGRYLGEHWAARGYVAVMLQHPGSDEGVWRDVPPRGRLAAMQEAANLENFLLRVGDVPAVLDALAAWNDEDGHPLAGRLDLAKVGMSGHSFGAGTTQAVGGQRFPVGSGFTDRRIRAAVIMSPSGPRGRFDPGRAFGAVAIPWLLMTGTKDDGVAITETTPAARRVVFPALPPGGKYELVLHDAEHSAFTDRALPGDRLRRDPNHHRAILALSTAFWDATLKGDAAAKAWLDGDGPRGVLQPEDLWSSK
jgi:predicted dienelactone hydrolase